MRSLTRRSSFVLAFLLQLVLAEHPTRLGRDSSGMNYQIKTTWDGLPVDHDPVSIKLVGKEEGVEIEVDAPFFGIPGNPGGKPGEPFDKLWEYEVVEVFFADGNLEKPKYLEVELSPWGQHLVLILDGIHNAVRTLLPIQYESSINSGRWKGKALVPSSYFPPGVTRFNAYAIHDVEHNSVNDPRRYESLFPAPTNKYPSANFHRLEYFQPLDFESLLPGNKDAVLSDPWPQDGEMESMEGVAVVSKEITAKYFLMGGKVPADKISSMTVQGVSRNETSNITFTAKGFLHADNMDETMRVYFANEKRRIVELIFSPDSRYEIKMFEEPYKRISTELQLEDVAVNSNKEEKTWNVTATVPHGLVPQNVSRVALAAVYESANSTETIYETTYYVTNAGICLPDLYVVKQYPVVKGLWDPAFNSAYSDLWGLEEEETTE